MIYDIKQMSADSKHCLAAYRRRKFSRLNISVWTPGSIVLRSILAVAGLTFITLQAYSAFT